MVEYQARELGVAGVIVEQSQLGCALEQRVVLVLSVDVDQPVEEITSAVWIRGQQHKKLVVTIEELAHLQQIAAKQPDDRSIRFAAKSLCTFRQYPVTLVAAYERPGGRLDRTPHVLT